VNHISLTDKKLAKALLIDCYFNHKKPEEAATEMLQKYLSKDFKWSKLFKHVSMDCEIAEAVRIYFPEKKEIHVSGGTDRPITKDFGEKI